MIVRRARAADRAALRAVHGAAFGGTAADPAEDVPEARLVDELHRDGDVVDALSLVAERELVVVGHVVCSRGSLAGRPVLGLGPLGVLPAEQGRGVGRALMHAVIGAADALDEPALVLLGDPAYYAQFGFVRAETLGITPPDPAWGEHFQARALSSWDDGLRGVYRYAAAFDRL